MKWFSLAFVVIGLAACGADGEPVQPTQNAHISITPNGVSGGARVGLRQGPLSLSVGLGL